MTIIDEAIFTILSGNSGVSAIVGTRIYPMQLPLECTLPALSFSKPSNPFRRVSGSPRFQIDCWAEDFLQCQHLRDMVETALNGYAGLVNSVNIIQIIPLEAPDMYDSTTGVYHIPYDFRVIYKK
jgi:hypothetical protein